MTTTIFLDHDQDSAPEASRRAMAAVTAHLGYLPGAVRRMAASPQLLEGFLKTSALVESSTLDPIAVEVVIMTVAVRNGCQVCVAMHSSRLTAMNADPALIASLRAGRELSDSRLEGVRRFTLRLMATAGEVDEEEVRRFLDHGFTDRNALEIVLAIGAFTISTLANRLTDAPLDEALRAHAWEPRKQNPQPA